MNGPSFELQKSIISSLKAHQPLMAVVSNVFDLVQLSKATPRLPYVSWGPEQEIPSDNGCFTTHEIYIQLDVWSGSPGDQECKNICWLIMSFLNNVTLNVEGFSFLSLKVETVRYLREEQSKILHGIISLKAMVEGD